jgi:MFS family permease
LGDQAVIESGSHLRRSPFRYLWAASALSSTGDAMAPIAITFAVLRAGHSAAALGAVLASLSVSRVAFTLVGGVWSDRLRRRSIMVAADLARGLSQGLLGALIVANHAPLASFIAASVVSGVGSAFFAPSAFGLLTEIVETSRLKNANAAMRFSQSAAFIFGPPVAGLLIAVGTAGIVILIDSATFLCSAILLTFVPSNQKAPAPQRTFITDLREGWQSVVSRPWVVIGLCLFASTNLGVAAFYVLAPVVIQHGLGGATAWGVIIGAGGAGGVTGTLFAPRLRLSNPLRLMAVLLLPNAFPAFLIASRAPPEIVAAAAFAAVGGVAVANIAWETTIQQWIPADLLGRINSYDLLVSYIVMPVGYAVAGPLASALGPTDVLRLAAAIVVLACLATMALATTIYSTPT